MVPTPNEAPSQSHTNPTSLSAFKE
jgi:hypothetical protein